MRRGDVRLRRWRRTAAAALLLLFLGILPAAAAAEGYAEQLSASGAQVLTERLPADTRELLESLVGDPLQPESYAGLSFDGVLRLLVGLLGRSRGGPLTAAASLTAVTVLSAMFGGLEGMTDNPALRQTYHTVSALAACGLLLAPFSALLRAVQQAADSVTVFMLSYVPVYGAILAAGGSGVGAVSYQTTLLAAAELLARLVAAVVLPVLTVSLALGCTGAVTEGFGLDALSAVLHKAILWTLGLFSTVFSGVLSVQQMVAAAGDSLGGRALKFSLSSFVPVVGGALSEAYSTVVGCAGLLRSTVGCFGLAAVLLIVLPPMAGCLCWQLCLTAASAAAALFRLPALEKLCRAAAGAVRVLIAVLAVFALLMVVSTSVIAFCGKGGGA